MTLPLQLTRRELLQTSTLGAALPTLSDDDSATDESLPDIDSIAAYLGIPSISYESVVGELWYRTVDPDPDWSDDCIYCIEQGIAALDSHIATADLPQPAVIDAGLELRVIPSATPNQPPAAYQHFASLFDPTAGDSDSENQSGSSTVAGVTTSNLSVGPYPGLRHEQDATRTGDDMSVLFYAQTLPWGTIHWYIAFDPGLEITLQTDDHQAWLHQRRDRDRNWPAMAPKHHWQGLHDSGRSEKGRIRGEVEPLVTAVGDIDRSKLHRVTGSMAGPSTVTHEAALSFGDETTHTNR